MIEKEGAIVVVAPIGEAPAYRAGIESGDRILSVGGQPTSGQSVEDVVRLLRGSPGTAVRVMVRRAGRDRSFELTLTREKIKVPSVRAAIVGDRRIGYARVSSFTAQADEQLTAAIDGMLGAGARALILDLRNNPGGLLESTVHVARMFMAGRRIVSIKPRSGEETSYDAYTAAHPDLPLMVLIDAGTASCAEILAAAVQDAGRATVIGEHSFGKGSIQTVFPVRGGAALALTTAYYLRPNGQRIHRRGIEPDIAVAMPKLTDEQKRTLREDQQRLIGSTSLRLQPVNASDSQLAKAVEVLQRWLAQPANKRTHPPR